VKVFQIFEIFTNLSSTSVKNASRAQRTATEAVKFVLRTDLRRETSPEGTRRARKRQKNFSRQILNTGPTTVGSARSCTMVSRVERTGSFFFFSLEKSRRHLDRPIKRHVARSYSIAKSGIGSWTSERICSPKTPIREIPIRSQPSVCQDTWRASQRPSAFQSSGFQAVKET
jgi:hypothetical protein